jgi:peptidase M23-like protein/HYR domain-containing protein
MHFLLAFLAVLCRYIQADPIPCELINMKRLHLLYAGFVFMAAFSAFAAAPVMDCSSNIVIDCTKASEPVDFGVTARDDAGRPLPVVCSPESGTVFALGLHRVGCTATDARGNSSSCTFFVEVEDTTPPTLTCPSNIVTQAISALGTAIGWRVSITDDCGPGASVTCTPRSGSVFPIGRTPVNCVARDVAGNFDQCSFLVIVLPPPPLRITRSESNNAVILRWAGNQVLQETPELQPGLPWRDSTLPVSNDEGELSVNWPSTGRTHFFRLRPIPFPNTRDTDGDGVLDSDDRCPNTPPGTPVDMFGCSAIDVVRAPEQLLEAVQKRWSEGTILLANIAGHTNPPFASADFSAVMRYADLAQASLNRAMEDFSAGELCRGADAYDSALSSWQNARVALEVLIREVLAEWHTRDPHPSGQGDVRPEEGYLINLRHLAAEMGRAHGEAENTLPAVQSACRSVEGPVATRGRVVSLNDAHRLVRLDTGATLVLPARNIPGHFDEGLLVSVSGLALNDGSIVATEVDVDASASAEVLYPKTVFRIAPVQPFPPEGSGPYTRHVPEAYQGIGTKLTLEGGMRLAAASVGGLTDGPQSTDSLKLELKYEKDGGGFTTLLAASALKPGDTPVTIPNFGSDKKFLGNEWIVVTLQRKNTNNTLTVVSTTNVPVRIASRGGVCWANYDQTEFDLVDPNDYLISTSTHVESITKNSLVFGPVDPSTTPKFEFRNSGGQLRENTDTFFIFNSFDPSGFDPGIYNDGSVYQQGVNYPVGITWPLYRGKRNQYTFWYSVGIDPIVRDRISACNGVAASYYKLPMKNGWPTWTMGQGNMNPGFTHCPGCYNQYAFDFVAAQNTSIRAARGGTVLDFDDSMSQNCWSTQLGDCIQNCPGANWLKIRHQDGTVGVYMHMPQNSVNLSNGQRVYRGDSIAKVGNVGCSSDPHLHFQVDPYDGASLSMQITFQAYNVCLDLTQWPFLVPCDYPNDIHDCYIPESGDILLSTQ